MRIIRNNISFEEHTVETESTRRFPKWLAVAIPIAAALVYGVSSELIFRKPQFEHVDLHRALSDEQLNEAVGRLEAELTRENLDLPMTDIADPKQSQIGNWDSEFQSDAASVANSTHHDQHSERQHARDQHTKDQQSGLALKFPNGMNPSQASTNSSPTQNQSTEPLPSVGNDIQLASDTQQYSFEDECDSVQRHDGNR